MNIKKHEIADGVKEERSDDEDDDDYRETRSPSVKPKTE